MELYRVDLLFADCDKITELIVARDGREAEQKVCDMYSYWVIDIVTSKKISEVGDYIVKIEPKTNS